MTFSPIFLVQNVIHMLKYSIITVLQTMSTLITNLPSYEVWVRKEYLTDHKSGHGEFTKGVWVSAKSIPGRAFYFETYLPEYAAMFDKLPISAFVSSPKTPNPDMTLHNLQFWNCMDYGVVAVQKQFIGSMHYEVYTRDFGTQTGTYVCTLDNYHSDVDAIDYSTSEIPAEHKSHNIIELDNGQYCLYPNNRMRIYDNSITPETPKVPDFKVSTVYYQVENGHDRDGLGNEENYFWKTAKERALDDVGVGNTAYQAPLIIPEQDKYHTTHINKVSILLLNVRTKGFKVI